MHRSRVLLCLALLALLLVEYLCFSNVAMFAVEGSDGLRFSTNSYLPVGDAAARILYRCQPVLTFPLRTTLVLAFRGMAASADPLPPRGLRGVVYRIAYPFFSTPLTQRAVSLNLVWMAVLNFALQLSILFLLTRLYAARKVIPAA